MGLIAAFISFTSLQLGLMDRHSVQIDPLNIPHPIPWNWVVANQTEFTTEQLTNTESINRFYRSQSLRSPNQRYAAYSRIQLHLSANTTRHRVSSMLFIENLETGNLQTINITSPLFGQPFSDEAATPPGAIAIVVPISWSVDSDRILAREFESIFGSDIASDYAVVWDCNEQRSYTLSPVGMEYNHAILLGWSQANPAQILFKTGMMGDEDWLYWTVNESGETFPAPDDQPAIHGEVVHHIWAGPQSRG